MPKQHTTAGNPRTWLHSALLAVVAIALAWFIPYAGPVREFVAPRVDNLGLLLSIIVGFVLYKSLSRRSDIDHAIAVELNKVRRIWHLAHHIAKAQPKAAPWAAAVAGGIREYLAIFQTTSFRAYELGSPLFRHVTYATYSLPSQVPTFNPQLYESLLDATGDATEAREIIRAKKDDTVSLFSWIVMIFIALALACIIIASTPYEPAARAVCALVVGCLLLVLQLIYEHDRPNGRRDRAWAARYVADLESLERAQRMKL